MKPIINCSWPLDSDFEYNKQIEIVVDNFLYNIVPEDIIRIIIIQETFNTQWLMDIVMNPAYDGFYTYVFTHNQYLLDNNSKAILFVGVNTWITKYDFAPKKFSVSTIVGGKIGFPSLEGHGLRHELWRRQGEIGIPKEFYLSSSYRWNEIEYGNNLVLGNNKEVMFNNQFHITIENTKLIHVYSEKLIDCFQTKAIPIYYGCTNIGDYFNIDGIIVVNTVTDMINVCNSLDEYYYESKLDAIEDNYSRSINFTTYKKILDRKLAELLN